jgi:hypothetical protein
MVRRGFTIVEAVTGAAMLGMLLAVCLQLMGAVAAQRRTVDQRQWATVELGNVLERITARPWAELTPQAVAGQQPAETIRNRLPGAELKIEISTPAAEPDAKRIVVSLRWRDRSGDFLPPLTVTTWKYRVGNEGREARDGGE